MRTSRDVVFDESRPFYPCPSSDASPASLVESLAFLLFPDAPLAHLPIPRLTLPSSESSSQSSPVVPDYTVKPPVTMFYNHCGAHLSDAPPFSDELSFDVSSFSFIEDESSSPFVKPSSPEQLIRRSHHLRWPLLYLSRPIIMMLFFIRNGST
jgi:hypothetical protein